MARYYNSDSVSMQAKVLTASGTGITHIPPQHGTTFGPQPSSVLAGIIGNANILAMAENGSILWGDSDKRTYYSPMRYERVEDPNAFSRFRYSVQGFQWWHRMGAVSLSSADGRSWVVVDKTEQHMYYFRNRRTAYESVVVLAASVRAGEPSKIVERGENVYLERKQPRFKVEDMVDNEGKDMEYERMLGGEMITPVNISEADALSVLSGYPPNTNLLDRIAMAFPHVSIRVYGIPLVCIDLATRRIAARVSMRSAFHFAGMSWPSDNVGVKLVDEALKFNKLLVVGGWAFDEYVEAYQRGSEFVATLNLKQELSPVPGKRVPRHKRKAREKK